MPKSLHTACLAPCELISAIDHCDSMPKFDKLFDRPLSGKYLICGGDAFEEWEKKLIELHFLIAHSVPVKCDLNR